MPEKGTIKKQFPAIIIIYLVSIIIIASAVIASTQDMPLIKIIEIKGNKKIEEETIRARIKSKAGEFFSQERAQNDIKTLFAIGYFDDVRVEVESFEDGIKLIYILKEKPTITSIDFQGNEEIETDKIKEKVTISAGAIASPPLISDNVQKIITFYQSEGYWHVKVIPVTRVISEDAVALTFQIEEGPKVTIKKIQIEGNKALSSREIKKAMETRERWLFSFITGSGFYKKEEMEADIERIRELYHSKGYIQVVVAEPRVTLSPDKKRIYINISVSEGEQFKVGSVDLKGNTVFASSELFQKIETAPGKVFNRKALRKDISNILDLYSEKGYALCDVKPMLDLDTPQKLVNLTLSISEGDIFRIGRVIITGNTKTRDKVIRREVRLDEGDVFNSKLMKRSYERITNTNYFDSVEITPEPKAEEKLVDVHVKVKERQTGMLSIGGGYSSVDKFIGMGEITQTNLFGKGYLLKLRAELSSRRANYNLLLRDPWFMDKPITASFGIYNETFKSLDYTRKAKGFSVGFGKELSEYIRGDIVYNLEKVEVLDVSDAASQFIKDQRGKKLTSSLSPSLTRDSRDNFLDPTRGSRNAIYTTFAGIGGDNYFVKALLDSGWYIPLVWDTTLGLRGRVGYASGFAGKELPVYERFYVGGINTVRGLGFGEGGPRSAEGEKIGGTKEVIFNAEFIFPLVKDLRLKGVAFFDAGRAYDKNEPIRIQDLRPTTGLGIRWISPLGPIRVEWGYNLSRKPDESQSKWEFTFGTAF
ncbi:MAG: outer membrane protein assembly factor BamA [Nitrospirae bacterium]|nr:outer membrane protein assembly factor BamA [Nitrospirota bacterium]